MRYVSLDIETTGTDPDYGQVLEIGAIIEDTTNPLPFEDLPKFKVVLKYDRYQGTPFAINMNKRIWEILAGLPEKSAPDYTQYCAENLIIPAEDAAQHFQKWLRQNGIDGRFVVAGKNIAGFDLLFLNKLPGWKQHIKVFRRVLDPGSIMIDWENDMIPPNSEECKRRAGLENTEISHDALEDAWDMIQILRSQYVGIKA